MLSMQTFECSVNTYGTLPSFECSVNTYGTLPPRVIYVRLTAVSPQEPKLLQHWSTHAAFTEGPQGPPRAALVNRDGVAVLDALRDAVVVAVPGRAAVDDADRDAERPGVAENDALSLGAGEIDGVVLLGIAPQTPNCGWQPEDNSQCNCMKNRPGRGGAVHDDYTATP
jgi:hypothetical protein